MSSLSAAVTPSSSFTAAKIVQSLRRDWLNHVAGFFRAVALLQTDVLLLQGFMLVSSKFTIYRLARSGDWTQTGYVILFASLSAFGLARLCSERLVQLDEAETAIWREHCDLLEPSEVQTLLACSRERVVPADAEPRMVLACGSSPKLLLLLEGKMQIDVERREGSASAQPVVIERGPGFTGEVSLISSLIDAHAREAQARADVRFTPGSRYLEFEMSELEAKMRKQPSLRNAVVALLARSMSGKLYATTHSLGKANERLVEVHGKLVESQYKIEVLDAMLDTLASSVRESDEHVALAPDGLRVLQPRLEALRRSRGVSADVQRRVLQEHGLDLERARAERQSLVELCEVTTGADSARHTRQYEALGNLVTRRSLVAEQTAADGASPAEAAGTARAQARPAASGRQSRLRRLLTLFERPPTEVTAEDESLDALAL